MKTPRQLRHVAYPKTLNADPRETMWATLQWLAWYLAGVIKFAAEHGRKTK